MASYDVFISYSSRNQQLAYAMCHALEQHKIKCWIAPRDVQPGNPYAREIIGGIKDSRLMVLIFTRDAGESEHVANELEMAVNYKKVIIPFVAENTPMNEEFSYYLKRKHWLTAYPEPEKAFAQLVEAVANALGMQTQPVESAKPSKPAPAPVPKTYKVGDYYNENGKEGVVFEVDETGRHGKIVGMKQVELQWDTFDFFPDEWEDMPKDELGEIFDQVLATEGNYKRIVTHATDMFDGMKNMQTIMRIPDWRSKYPAFAWCAEQGEGWYLPAIEELKSIFQFRTKEDTRSIDEILRRYWSSSEHENSMAALSFSLLSSETHEILKHFYYFVRAVSAF